MITFEKACSKAVSQYGSVFKIHTAWDFGSFWVFSIAPFYISENESYDTGTVFTAVNKQSGRVFEYDITYDPDAYFNATVLYPKEGDNDV